MNDDDIVEKFGEYARYEIIICDIYNLIEFISIILGLNVIGMIFCIGAMLL